jgi:hypothetical protein
VIPYYILFGLPAAMALIFTRRNKALQALLPAFGVLLVFMIGFRWRVGGDWGFERILFENIYYSNTFLEALSKSDPGFALIAMPFAGTGLGVWTLNTVAGLLFSIGLMTYCAQEKNPWLALTVAVPYLVIVVAMGYSRQSVAIGFEFLALLALERRKLNTFVFYVILACLFHTTAVVVFLLGLLSVDRKNFLVYLCGMIVAGAAFFTVYQARADNFELGYLQAGYSSSGATIRTVMNVIPAIIFLLSEKHFQLSKRAAGIWRAAAIFALALGIGLIVSPSSTAIDRLALYLLPLQVLVLGRLPYAWGSTALQRAILTFAVIAYMVTVMTVWLFFADNASSWIPYQIFPPEQLIGRRTGFQ